MWGARTMDQPNETSTFGSSAGSCRSLYLNDLSLAVRSPHTASLS